MGTIEWLLNREHYIQYATRINILKQDKRELEALRKQVLSDKKIKELLEDVANFNEVYVSGHKDPGLPLHKLGLLLDIGLDVDVPEIKMARDIILSNGDDLGIYKSRMKISQSYGGTGEDTFGWALCDAPLMLLSLIKLGVDYEKHIKKGVEYILLLHKENGFPCVVSSELGKFRGPGRKDDCCPYATLITLKLLLHIPEYKNSETAISCANVFLNLWENSREAHPYMFYMGTDFRKLKAPAIWYDIVSVADCLSHFEHLHQDKRFLEIISLIKEKENEEGLFTPESIYMKCKEWDFGIKKQASGWLTYLCFRILERYNNDE